MSLGLPYNNAWCQLQYKQNVLSIRQTLVYICKIKLNSPSKKLPVEFIVPYHIRRILARDGAVVRALASHRCGSGSILELDAICGLSLLIVLFSSLPREVFLRVIRFSPLLKNQHFQILIRSRFQSTNNHYVEVPLQIPIPIFHSRFLSNRIPKGIPKWISCTEPQISHAKWNRNFSGILIDRMGASILPKILKVSVGIQMERSVSVSSDRNIRDHFWRWSTYFSWNIPIEIRRSIFDKPVLCPNRPISIF